MTLYGSNGLHWVNVSKPKPNIGRLYLSSYLFFGKDQFCVLSSNYTEICTRGFRSCGLMVMDVLINVYNHIKYSCESIYQCFDSSPFHDDVIKWKYFPRYWPCGRGIHRSPVNSPHKGKWRGALTFCLICARINGWVNTREAGDLRPYRTHYDVRVMLWIMSETYRWICLGQYQDDVIKWKHFPRYWPLCGEFTGHRRIPLTKASDAEFLCFLWSTPEHTVE